MDSPLVIAEILKSVQLPSPPQFLALKSPPPEDGHYSHIGQDKIVDRLLGNKTNGFFVECGAAEGESISNSIFFELKRNWTGLLVEANKEMYPRLAAKRRNAYSINSCLSPVRFPRLLGFVEDGFYGGLQNYHAMPDNWVNNKVNIQGGEKLSICYPLYSIMLALKQTRIDYFSLDVEGSELNILSTIPFDKLYIDVLTIECGQQHRFEATRKFFKELGMYKEVQTVVSDIIFKHI